MRERVRSIRATLLAGQALVLIGTVVVFAAVLYSSRRNADVRALDERIGTRVAAIAAAAEDDEEDGVELELSDAYLAEFSGGEDAPYFLVWDSAGAVALSSGVPGEVPLPTAEGFRDRPPRREATRRGADGLTVLVGVSTAPMVAAHREFLLSLVGAGAIVLALGLAAGWLLAGRVLAPIRRMSEAAAGISEADPTRRLDVGRTETELGSLAATLNDAFDRMHEAVERRTRFTADASHELRTPVSVVLATAEQALGRERTAAEYEEALETVRRAARRMKHLVDDLLTLTRADAGDLPLARDPVDLAEVSDEVLDLVRPLAAAADVSLALDGAPGIVVPGDRERLRDAVTNLVRNAIRYNRPGGRVTVSVRNGGADAAIAVEDTGIGIPREHRARLFERFTRVDEARSRRDGGAGLGLAIAASIVDGHGGTIDVDSTPDVGSTFTITLPRGNE